VCALLALEERKNTLPKKKIRKEMISNFQIISLRIFFSRVYFRNTTLKYALKIHYDYDDILGLRGK
jgi:hypothetical protein